MYRLSMITKNSIIFVEIKEDDKEEKTVKISIGDNVKIQNRAGELREFYARVYDVDPYITLIIGNGTVSFRIDESIHLEILCRCILNIKTPQNLENTGS